MYQLGYGRGVVELKIHAGWNTCNPSLLLGYVFCWCIKHPPFFISSARLAHTPMNHTHEHTHVSCHDYSHSFHHKTLFFSPCCKPCKFLCCVLHRFTHMLCRFELFLSVTVLSLAYLFLNYFCYVYIQIHSLYVWSYMSK